MRKILTLSILALLAVFSAFGQTTMTSTTLAAAVTDPAATSITLASATGVQAGGFLYIPDGLPGETLQVAGSYTSGTLIPVIRGRGSAAKTHLSGATVYVVTPGLQARNGFVTVDPSGSCTSTNLMILPVVNTVNGRIWNCISSQWTPLVSGIAAPVPLAASVTDLGSDTLPFRTAYLTSSIQFEGSGADANETTLTVTNPTGDRTVTIPDATGTVSLTKAYACGTVAACSPTLNTGDWEFVGSVALTSASPSTATVTGLSPAYTSTTSYICTLTPVGNTAAIAAAGAAFTAVSGSSFTITGPNTVTTVINYRCRGN